ncbi:hypothetical protein N7520_001655 [Penicillium odoratum]|uniref:uncharacterized protein n=1 Tax=Penicillium odoratum TaxID=1167516 RepID=UPI00254995F2|nr:uncharacterized protein N7520_001655 [Penicillium odoratum]KAJ5778409.1 hypothetical protein N7520_001655 [Penicillium odoratum]
MSHDDPTTSFDRRDTQQKEKFDFDSIRRNSRISNSSKARAERFGIGSPVPHVTTVPTAASDSPTIML